MVYAVRSMNADLHEGMTDGKYKKIVQNRGGVVENVLFYDNREDLSDTYYGIHEDADLHCPDGTNYGKSIYYVPNGEVSNPTHPGLSPA